MYTIKTRLAPSKIHGIGVFTINALDAGEIVWRFDPIVDRIVRKDEIAYLPAHVIEHLSTHGYTRSGCLILALDHKMYTNYARPANLQWIDNDQVFMVVDRIPAGEELTMDYAQYSESEYAKSLR